jgi:hypothetical protein
MFPPPCQKALLVIIPKSETDVNSNLGGPDNRPAQQNARRDRRQANLIIS